MKLSKYAANAPVTRAALPTLARVGKYTLFRIFTLAPMVGLGVFLAVVLINYGGYIDKIFRERIDQTIMGMEMGMRGVPIEERLPILEQARAEMQEAYGLNQPFLGRCFQWFLRGVTFDWGYAERIRTTHGKIPTVRDLILERLPNTLLLAGAANLLLFFASLYLSLFLSRRYGSLLDKLMAALSPLSSVPNWIYGVLLTVVFAFQLRVLPYGGMSDALPWATDIERILNVGQHMLLPVTAIFLGMFFQVVSVWRTLFLIHSSEDYIDLAVAKGLPPRLVEQRYILRPALPYIITDFALTVIAFWQGILVLEMFFNWPGVGNLFMQAIGRNDRPITVALVVLFAYLLAASVFGLDIIYAVIDPRVKLDGEKHTQRAAGPKAWWRFWERAPTQAARGYSPPAAKSQRQAGGPSLEQSEIRRRKRASNMRWLGISAQEALRYPWAALGAAMILGLVGLSLYAVIALPYPQAVRLWRGGQEYWYRSPKTAQPAWTNLFRQDDLPETLVLSSRDESVIRKEAVIAEGIREIVWTFPFDYGYAGGLPQDLYVFMQIHYNEKRPAISLNWLRPDGQEIELGNFMSVASKEAYYLSGDTRLERRLRGQPPMEALMADPRAPLPQPLLGPYALQINALVFEEDTSLDMEMVLYGQAHGLFGTDHLRRDLGVALLWGAPVALALGLLGAVGTTLASMLIAAVGAWFGGWVDSLIQRITEINMVLPTLPLAMMVYFLYSKSVWVVLGVVILLSILGKSIKNYRAIFLQVVQAPYIEAAQVYGASHGRIILRYMVPRIMPILIPQMVILVPGYVFLEATLAYLRIGDPYLPTWGKLLNDALSYGALNGLYYWVLQPIALLLLTGLAFAMVGFALDRILNPRLRQL